MKFQNQYTNDQVIVMLKTKKNITARYICQKILALNTMSKQSIAHNGMRMLNCRSKLLESFLKNASKYNNDHYHFPFLVKRFRKAYDEHNIFTEIAHECQSPDFFFNT